MLWKFDLGARKELKKTTEDYTKKKKEKTKERKGEEGKPPLGWCCFPLVDVVPVAPIGAAAFWVVLRSPSSFFGGG